MKNFIVPLIFLFVLFSCKKSEKLSIDKFESKSINYPEALKNILTRHGGLSLWKETKTLSFNIGEEVHTSDLESRKIVVNAPKYAIGFDGNSIWKIEEVPNSFKGNKDFYYNLYFYFYAMPFVLADEGIIYSEADSLIFDNKKYPGIKIAFKNDVGTSPDDNYILYYHPETYQMEWLAYTVTFRSKKPSDKYNLIRYNDWAKTEGLLLPKSIVWYKKGENGQPEEPARSPVKFTLPLVSKTKLEDSFFEKPKE